jgi:hypothetical protein
VRVLADAGEAKVDRTRRDALVESLELGVQVPGVAVDRDELRLTRELADETFAQILAEAGAVRLGQADILVQVEDRDLGPIDGQAP